MTGFRVTPGEDQRFGCFLVHVHALRVEGEQTVHFVVEDVGTAEKQRFGSIAEMHQFLIEWSTR